MEKIQFKKEGILKQYLNLSYPYCVDFPVLIFFISLLTIGSFANALVHAFAVGIIILLFILYAYLQNEIYSKKHELLKYQKLEIFDYLRNNNFKVNKDLYFEGTHQGYQIIVFLITREENGRNNDYVCIRAFYKFASSLDNIKRERDMSGKYYIGELFFENNCVTYMPYDWENPDFQENFNGLVSVLKRENLLPLTKEEWFQLKEESK